MSVQHEAREPLAQALVVIPIDALRQIVREETDAALEEHASARPDVPLAVTGAKLAALLSVSRATVHRWRKRGMPAIPTGDEYRYRVVACVEWLERGGGAT